MRNEYDFAVLGGGSAGYAAASTAAGLGLKTVVIEAGPEIGGLCILRGCMPSKTLIESADHFLTLRHASEFGLHAAAISFNPAEIMDRKKRLVAEFADYRRGQLEAGRFDFVRGHAAFLDSHTVEIKGCETIRARTFLIATGSKIQTVTLPGLSEIGCLDSDAVLNSEQIPPSVIVLGGGLSNIPSLYRDLPQLVEGHAFKPEAPPKILQNRYGDSSGVRGAAWLATK